jgi:hypothetical protein
MATPIKETPILKGKNAHAFLKKLVNKPNFISKEELKKRKENYNSLESIRKF